MKHKEDTLSVVFFGSGPVAAESLRLLQEEFDIEAVVTKPTTKHEMAVVSGNAPIHCVSDKTELDELFTTKKFKSKVGILIDFGIIVNKKIIDYFPKGIVNSHFSLLPHLRGADPLSFAILTGKSETGVSLMLLVEAMDEGPLLHQSICTIQPNETTPSLTGKLIIQSAHDLSIVIPKWINGGIEAYEQNEDTTTPTYTRKLSKNDGLLDFSKPAEDLEREIRAYADWPKSTTRLGDIDAVILKASTPLANPEIDNIEIGAVTIHGKKLYIQCGKGVLSIDRIKPAGKKEMDIAGFLNGYGDRINT